MRISIDHASIRFGKLEVLEDVSLEVPSGDLVAVVGPSGCGKSTLLNAMAGLLSETECRITGSIALDGLSPRGSRLGYVFQRDTLLPWATLLDNVQVGMTIRGVAAPERLRRARDLMRSVGLEGFESYYPHQVSGGMRQRTQLIRTLAYEPDAILMDEPFGALDAQNRMLLQAELLRVWEQRRTTILFVTHDLAEAIVLGQRVVVMSRRPGRIKRVYEIPLPSPRDPFELRATDEFARLETSIWADLRDEFRAGVAA
ncbi:MAG TPA: ABC transporter ATP-binding protein [Candidatus Limnocylindria bacterium]|nr:ABC transporter ATP-binding protein [Candidatus Limnocylindria bacterium]